MLLVEDEAKLAALVARGLTERGDVVDVVATGSEALASARERGVRRRSCSTSVLPDLDGFEVCRRLRAERVWTPVLMLTARTAVADRIAGLDSGADDYLAKPFAFQELLARMRALARRGPVPRPTELEVGDLRLDPAGRRVWRGADRGVAVGREFALLEAFMRRPGQVLTREQLLALAWGDHHEVASNVVDVYVRYLRAKIDRPFGVEHAAHGARRGLSAHRGDRVRGWTPGTMAVADTGRAGLPRRHQRGAGRARRLRPRASGRCAGGAAAGHVAAEADRLEAMPGRERLEAVRALGGEVHAQVLTPQGDVRASSSLVAGPFVGVQRDRRGTGARAG